MYRAILLVFTILLLTGCGNSQLRLDEKSPSTDATAVSTIASVSATFNVKIDSTTVNASSFKIVTGQGQIDGKYQVDGKKIIFTPNQPFSLLCKYSVTITQDIKGINGQHLLSDDQWGFTTRDGQWETLNPPANIDPNSSRTAINDSGKVLLTWSTTDGTYTSFFENGVWTPAVNIGESGYINEVVTTNNDFAVFWQNRYNNNIKLYCAQYRNGDWQPAYVVASVDASAVYIAPAIFSDGSIFIIYWYSGSDGPHASSRRYILSEGWQDAESLGAISWLTSGFDKSGKAIIAWSDTTNTPNTAYVKKYDIESGWSAPISVGQYSRLNPNSAVINGKGDSMVSFSELNNIMVAHSINNKDWNTLSTVYTREPNFIYTPPLMAIDFDGNVMLVMAKLSQESSKYLAIRYNSVNGWDNPIEINQTKIPDPMQMKSSLKSDELGNFMLIWFGYDSLPDGIEHVYSSRYQKDVGWNAPVYVGRQDADALFPIYSMNRRGEVAAVFLNFYPPGYDNFTMSLGMGLFH